VLLAHELAAATAEGDLVYESHYFSEDRMHIMTFIGD
jgi:hypothetical protein